jgi:hypothetical protein
LDFLKLFHLQSKNLTVKFGDLFSKLCELIWTRCVFVQHITTTTTTTQERTSRVSFKKMDLIFYI